MFGRPAAPAPVADREQRQPARRERSIPPGLAPFVPVIVLVVVLAAFLIAPVVGVILVVAALATLFWLRFRQVRGLDYLAVRSEDPLWRAWNELRRGRLRWGSQDQPPE